MSSNEHLLTAYDEQLRVEGETASALSVQTLGPLLLVTFYGGSGFVTYPAVHQDDPRVTRDWVRSAQEYFAAMPQVQEVEWKTRGHDRIAGLDEALTEAGFVAQEPESIMIGEAALLDVPVELPPGVTLRRITSAEDAHRAAAMQAEVFGDPPQVEPGADLVHRMSLNPEIEMWVAEADGEVVSAGRLEPVEGTDFAGVWGGATLPQWRGRGIYRALTAERARSALRLGKTLINSDSTEFSRPILERAGFRKVSTTTPYEWTPVRD